MNLQSEKYNEGLLKTCAKLSHMKVETLKSQIKTIDWEKEIRRLKILRAAWFLFLLFVLITILTISVLFIINRESRVSYFAFIVLTAGLVIGTGMFYATSNKYNVFKLLKEQLA